MSAARKKSKLFAVVAAGGEEKPRAKQTLYQKFKSSRDLDNISDYSSAPMRVVDAQPTEVKDVKPILRAVQLSAALIQQISATSAGPDDKENRSVPENNVIIPVAEGRPRKKSVTFEDGSSAAPPLPSLPLAAPIATAASPAKPSAMLFAAEHAIRASPSAPLVRPFAVHPLSVDVATGGNLTREYVKPSYAAPPQPQAAVPSPVVSPAMFSSSASRRVFTVGGPAVSPMSMSSLSSHQQLALASAVAAIIRPTSTMQNRNNEVEDNVPQGAEDEEEQPDMDEADDNKPNFFFKQDDVPSVPLASMVIDNLTRAPVNVQLVEPAAPAVSTVRTEPDSEPEKPAANLASQLATAAEAGKPINPPAAPEVLVASPPILPGNDNLNMSVEMDVGEDQEPEKIHPHATGASGTVEEAHDIVMTGQVAAKVDAQNAVVAEDTSPPDVSNPSTTPFDTTPPAEPVNRALQYPEDKQVHCHVAGAVVPVHEEALSIPQPAPLFRMKTEQLHGYGKSPSIPIRALSKDAYNNAGRHEPANTGLPRTPMVVAAAQKALLAAAADLINDTSRSIAAHTVPVSKPAPVQSAAARPVAVPERRVVEPQSRESEPGPSAADIPAPSWGNWKKAAVQAPPAAPPKAAPVAVAPVAPVQEPAIPVAQIIPQQAQNFGGYMPQMPPYMPMYPPMPQWQYPGANPYYPPYFGYGQPSYPMMPFGPPNPFSMPQPTSMAPMAIPTATAAPEALALQPATAPVAAIASNHDSEPAPHPETMIISLDESSLHSSDCDLSMPHPSPSPSPSPPSNVGTDNTEDMSVCTTQQLAVIAAQQHQNAMEVAHFRTAVPALTPLTEIAAAEVESVQEAEMSVGIDPQAFVLAPAEKVHALQEPAAEPAVETTGDFEFDAGDYPAEEDMVAGDALLSLQKSKTSAAPSPVAHGLALSVAYDAELDIVTPSQDWLMRVPSICSTTRDGPGNGKAIRRRRKLTAQLAETGGINEHSFNSVLCTLTNVGAGGMCPPDLYPSPEATIIYPEACIRTPAFPALSLVQLAAPGKFKLRYTLAVNDCDEHMRGPLYPRQHESPIGWKGTTADTDSSPMQWSSYLSESPVVVESPAKRRRKTSNV